MMYMTQDKEKYELCDPLLRIFEKCVFDTKSTEGVIHEALLNLVNCEIVQQLPYKK